MGKPVRKVPNLQLDLTMDIPRETEPIPVRPMKRRSQPYDLDEVEAAASIQDGGMMGTNRAPRVVETSRKRRIA